MERTELDWVPCLFLCPDHAQLMISQQLHPLLAMIQGTDQRSVLYSLKGPCCEWWEYASQCNLPASDIWISS